MSRKITMSTQQNEREISSQDFEMADPFWEAQKYDLMEPIEDAVNEAMRDAMLKMAAEIRPRLGAEMHMADNLIDISATLDGFFLEGGKSKTFSECLDEMIENVVVNGGGEDREIRRKVAEILKSEANRIASQPDE